MARTLVANLMTRAVNSAPVMRPQGARRAPRYLVRSLRGAATAGARFAHFCDRARRAGAPPRFAAPAAAGEPLRVPHAAPGGIADLGAHEGDRLTLVMSRCDTPKASPRACGGWSGAIVLAR
jgi:hypothetical protein